MPQQDLIDQIYDTVSKIATARNSRDPAITHNFKGTAYSNYVYVNGNAIGYFRNDELYGCCGVAVLHGAWVMEGCTGQGLGALLLEAAEQSAFEDGYTLMLATDVADNVATAKLFERAGWTIKDTFTNSRTHNKVNVYTKDLGYRNLTDEDEDDDL